MKSVLAAETAILVHLETIGGIALILSRVIVSLLAFAANESYFDSFFFTRHIFRHLHINVTSLCFCLCRFVRQKAEIENLMHNKKTPNYRGRPILTENIRNVNTFFWK